MIDNIGALAAALDGDDRLLVRPDQPLDPSSAVASELGDELARGMAGGEAALDERFATTPAVRSGWIVEDNITIDGATAIRNLGIPLLVVPPDRYREFGNNLGDFTDPTLRFSTALVDESSLPVMVVDPITEQLETGASGSPIERAVRLMGDVERVALPTRPRSTIADPDHAATSVCPTATCCRSSPCSPHNTPTSGSRPSGS